MLIKINRIGGIGKGGIYLTIKIPPEPSAPYLRTNIKAMWVNQDTNSILKIYSNVNWIIIK